ncbi:MAG: cupin domain-containing protein [Anaerolineaceae bacterium]|nr:cupin domain-containing protein [Anaerolineaceae bacterium]
MAKLDEVFENPHNGNKIQFLITATESKGEVLKVKIWTPANVPMPPEHIHPLQTDAMEVVQGQMRVKVNGHEQVLSVGQKIVAPKNTPHQTWAEGSEELIVVHEIKPALKTESFFETQFALAAQGKSDANGVPKNFLQFATILNENYGEIFVTNPPVPVQKFVAQVIGRLGRLFGYKGFVPFQK